MTQRATPRQVNLLRDGICLAEWEVRHVGARGCTHAVQPHNSNAHRQRMTGFPADARQSACPERRRKDQHERRPAKDRRHSNVFNDKWEECTMAVSRRKVLKGGTALAGGMAAILASGRAPAFAQGTTVHWIRWNDFVPASDQLLRKDLIPEAEKALGIKINFETVNGNDLQPRITAAIQSGSGPDVFMLFNNHPQLYAASLTDMGDLADAQGKAEGGYYPYVNSQSNDGKRWVSLPWTIVGGMIAYRKSWFDE